MEHQPHAVAGRRLVAFNEGDAGAVGSLTTGHGDTLRGRRRHVATRPAPQRSAPARPPITLLQLAPFLLAHRGRTDSGASESKPGGWTRAGAAANGKRRGGAEPAVAARGSHGGAGRAGAAAAGGLRRAARGGAEAEGGEGGREPLRGAPEGLRAHLGLI